MVGELTGGGSGKQGPRLQTLAISSLLPSFTSFFQLMEPQKHLTSLSREISWRRISRHILFEKVGDGQALFLHTALAGFIIHACGLQRKGKYF